jgi:hypothetical protein
VEEKEEKALGNSSLHEQLINGKTSSWENVIINTENERNRMMILLKHTVDGALDDDKDVKNKAIGESLHWRKRHG